MNAAAAPRVLCLLIEGFEEIETVAPVDLLRRAGATVTLASVRGELWVTGRCQMMLKADVSLAEVVGGEFELLLIPGGPGVAALRADGQAARLASDLHNRGKLVAAICAAPTLLADAGLLTGKRFTAHGSVKAELPGLLEGEPVVEDGLLITSRGAGTAIEFGLALVSRLFGADKARTIGKSIHWRE
ncbi:MAG: DJ-1/PfpI family protein [Verrucomicrobiales bacterium]|nr:DJ-1/PfpI family protein [Verrucomicrobiales bacterium]